MCSAMVLTVCRLAFRDFVPANRAWVVGSGMPNRSHQGLRFYALSKAIHMHSQKSNVRAKPFFLQAPPTLYQPTLTLTLAPIPGTLSTHTPKIAARGGGEDFCR